MCDENKQLGKAVKRIARSERRRGHATWFHAGNEFQDPMEVYATAQWAREMNERHGHQIIEIRTNPGQYPDCLAEMNGEKIGVEVTELVDEDAIREFQKTRHEQLPEWPLDKFRERLAERVGDKDKRSRDSSLHKQFLLIVTDEPFLDETALAAHLANVELPRPKNFDAVYVMASYVPNSGGEGYYPLFEVRFSDPA